MLPSESVELTAEFFTRMMKALSPKINEGLVYEILLPLFIEIEAGEEMTMDTAATIGLQIAETASRPSKVH